MATVNKDFRIKNGLIVEGTTATVNGYDILTKKQGDQDYIVGLIGGTATPNNTPDTVVKRDSSGNFAAGTITANISGNVTGDVTGTVSSLSNHTTDALGEGSTNKYFTDQRALDATAQAYDVAGSANTAYTNAVADAGTAADQKISTAITNLDLANTYDALGAAQGVQDNLDDHIADTSTHGVTGDIVGTTDTQSLSNKTFMGQTNFQSAGGAGGTANHIDVDSQTGKMTVTSGYALDVTAANDIAITSTGGDIVINPDGSAYIGSASAGNEIATNSYVDNAVSGLTWKQAVHLLYDAAIPVLSGSGATQLQVDGHTVLGDANSGYRLLLAGGTSTDGIYVYNSTGGSWTLTRAEDADAYTELVGAAVFVMEGTQYGQTSWVQSNHYLSSFTGQSWTQFSGSGSVVAGTGITVDGLEISVDRNTVDAWYDAAGDAADAEAAANLYTDGQITTALQTAQGYANTAETNANNYTNTAITNLDLPGTYDPLGAAATALQDAKDYADALDTDDVAEGITNQYFTDSRAKTSAADLLTGATLSNITITGDENGLTITAEDGIAGKTTDDLGEGSTNLYFQDSRVYNAIEGSNIQPQSVDITWVRREEATWTDVATASKTTCHSAGTSEGSMKYLVRVTASVGGTRHSHVTEVLATVDGANNVAVVEYGTVYTSAEPLATVTVEWNAATSKYDLNVTTANNSSEVMVAATLMAALD